MGNASGKGGGVPGRVFITQPIPEPGPSLLRREPRPSRSTRTTGFFRGTNYAQEVAGCDAVVCLLTDTIDTDVLTAAAARCPAVRQHGDRLRQYRRRGSHPVGDPGDESPGVLAEATADLTWALLLAVARRVVEGDHGDAPGAVRGLGAVVLARGRRQRADAWPGRAGPDRDRRGGAGPRVPGCGCSITAAGRAPRWRPWAPRRSAWASCWPRATSSACTFRSPPRPSI